MKVLFFKAPWCTACHTIEADVPTYCTHVDCEKNPEIAQHYNVTGLPCFIITMDSGDELARLQTTEIRTLNKWYENIKEEYIENGR